MSTSRLFLTGIRCTGRHGANPGEKDAPQDFIVDLDLDVNYDSDDIGATADYRRIAQAARETVVRESFDLLESLAEALAKDIRAMPNVTRVTAVVHKPSAARSIGIEGVAAGATVGGD